QRRQGEPGNGVGEEAAHTVAVGKGGSSREGGATNLAAEETRVGLTNTSAIIERGTYRAPFSWGLVAFVPLSASVRDISVWRTACASPNLKLVRT
ncbi:MAG: hypothetical protein ABJN52_14480, partial [Litorimonas sp.]